MCAPYGQLVSPKRARHQVFHLELVA
jgi:hypothetical protein